MSAGEYEALRRKAARVGCSPATFLRLAALEAVLHVVPPVNRDCWVALARTASDVHELVRAVRSGRVGQVAPELLRGLRSELYATRQALLGNRPHGLERARDRDGHGDGCRPDGSEREEPRT